MERGARQFTGAPVKRTWWRRPWLKNEEAQSAAERHHIQALLDEELSITPGTPAPDVELDRTSSWCGNGSIPEPEPDAILALDRYRTEGMRLMSKLDALEHDLRQSRQRLSETLDELRYRTRPANIRDAGAAYLGDTAPARFISNLKDDVFGKPVPIALLGLAIAWLAVSREQRKKQLAPAAGYSRVFHWANRLLEAAQQNASKAARTVQATTSTVNSGVLQHASDMSAAIPEQLSRATGRARDFGQDLTNSAKLRSSAATGLARTHPLALGAATAGLLTSAAALAFVYSRYAGELNAASNLVSASEREDEKQSLGSLAAVEEHHASLVPEEIASVMRDGPLSARRDEIVSGL